MGVAFDTLQAASFDANKFPCEEIVVLGTLRDHIHEFPHSPTGQPEKMGRKNYEITMRCPFNATFPRYPRLWPDTLDAIRGLFEQEKTAPLHIPTIGTINAYIHQIREVATGEDLSGEKVDLIFYEDNPTEFILDALVTAGSNGLRAQGDIVIADAGLDVNLLQTISGAIALLDDAVNAVLTVRDQADIYGLLLASHIDRLAGQCDALDKALRLNTTGGAKVIDSLHDLWASTIKLAADIKGKHTDLQIFTVPSLMSVTDVSAALYKDNSHAIELLQLNDLDDAFAIKPNTKMRYYPIAA